MRFHVAALPHTNTTKAYSSCAYTGKVIRFCQMMKSLGHTVFLYGGKENEAPCDEFIPCSDAVVSPAEDYTSFPFDPKHPAWVSMNNKAIGEIVKTLQRKQPGDFLCLIAGLCQKPIADAVPDMMAVEFGVGYGGVFSKYRVFESYAWMHTVYGCLYGPNAHAIDGRFFDAVIPNYFDPSEFPFSDTKDDYYLYVGRLTDRKGWRIAQDVCQRLGKQLIVAGSGEFSGYGEYVGSVDSTKRGELMSRAQAVFVPTQYLEPFGGVAVEAMLCGTPVITTDFGAFTETIQDGITGIRCHTLKEFMEATEHVKSLDYKAIRQNALSRYSMDIVKDQYQEYFERLMTLYGDGWYQL